MSCGSSEELAGMAATMKALRKMDAARGLRIESVPVPEVGHGDVLVRVKAASICGTDFHSYGWDRWSQGRIKPPVTLGHEVCEDSRDEYLEAGCGDSGTIRRDFGSAGERGAYRAGGNDRGADGAGDRVRADWI